MCSLLAPLIYVTIGILLWIFHRYTLPECLEEDVLNTWYLRGLLCIAWPALVLDYLLEYGHKGMLGKELW